MLLAPIHATSLTSPRPLRASWQHAGLCLATALGMLGCDPTLIPDDMIAPPELAPVDPEPETDPDPEAVTPPVTPRPTGPSVGLCPTEARWFQREAGFSVMDNSFLGITPNEGLVLSTDSLGGSGNILRMDGGEVVAQGALSGLLDVDRTWRRRLDHLGTNLAVRDLITAEELAFMGNDETTSVVGGALSEDGSRAASVTCLDGVVTLEVRDVDAVQTLFEGVIDAQLEYCPYWSEPGLGVVFGPSNDIVVVGLPRLGSVHIVDVALGTQEGTVVHTLGGEPPFFAEPSALLSLSVDPSGTMLVTTGGEGLLRRFKLPGLIEIGEAIDVGIVAVNLSVYAMPRTSSPSAVSPDGTVIAALFPADPENLEERPVPMLIDAATGELLHVVDVPTPDEGEFDNGEADHAIGLSFSNTGRALVGRFGGGVGLWACEDFSVPTAAPLAVLLEGPTSTAAGELLTFTATHLGSDALHSHTFFMNGEMLWGRGGLERTASWTIHEPGTYEISVVVDDGASTGTTSLMLEVH